MTFSSYCRFLSLSIFIWANSFILFGQEEISIGNKFTIHSNILDDEREYWVSLPKSYNDTIYSQQEYPVCYFFDGDTHFENLVAIRDWLTRGLYASMPEVILVGIIQKDRTNELTPSHIETPEEWKRANFSTSGGNALFMEFIEKELKPIINSNYRTIDYEILIGHSFGGLTTVNTFIESPETFNAYLALDPSIWWDDKLILSKIDTLWNEKEINQKTLYIAQANDPGSGDEHISAIRELNMKINTLNQDSSLNYHYSLYKEYDHGSVVIPGEYEGLRFIFEGYELDVKQVMRNPSTIPKHYNEISQKLGYKIIPPEHLLDQMAKICDKQELYIQSEELLRLATVYYPNSSHAKSRYTSFKNNNHN